MQDFSESFLFIDVLYRYHRLALKFHPAKNPDDLDALYKFHDLAEAYDVLSDRMFQFIYILFDKFFFLLLSSKTSHL